MMAAWGSGTGVRGGQEGGNESAAESKQGEAAITDDVD